MGDQQQQWAGYDGSYYDPAAAAAEPYYDESLPADQQGYYDANGEWHYYQYEQPYTDQQQPNDYQQNQGLYPYDQQSTQQQGQQQGYADPNQPWEQQPQHPASFYSSTEISGPPTAGHYPNDAAKKKSTSRIDPRQIPRPKRASETFVEGSEFGGASPAKLFYTSSSGTSPPCILDECHVIDDGNCSPRFMRMTSYHIPCSSDLVDSTRLSIGAIIRPLALPGPGEEPVPLIDMGESGPLRCSRCAAYLNSFSTFTEDGLSFNCTFCDMRTPLPHWYHCNVDANGMRRDRNERPELHLGSVEYIAPDEFSTRPLQEPRFLFVIDVSNTAIQSGLLAVSLAGIRASLDIMAENPRVHVGIISYSSAVHVYNLKMAKDPSMLIVADIDNAFVPIPAEQICVRPNDPAEFKMLEILLEKIPALHAFSNEEQGNIFGSAVHIAVEALVGCGGKVLITQSRLPNVGQGALDDRNDVSLYATDKEKELFLPGDSYYQVQATLCAENVISVDLFVCANTFVDIATIGVLSTMTGGQIYYYPEFHAAKDGYAVQCDMMATLTRETGFEGTMVVRTSTGLKVGDYFGNFFHRDPQEMDLPVIDCDKSFGVRIEHESTLVDKSFAFVQAALLYTTFNGQRRIRVHTLRIPTTSNMGNVFKHADLGTVVNISLRQACLQMSEVGVAATRAALSQAVIDVFFMYRKRCASSTSSGQLILPESLKLLPIFTIGMLKSAVMLDCVPVDQRMFAINSAHSMPIMQALKVCLPSMYGLHLLPECPNVGLFAEDGSMVMPSYELTSSEYLEQAGIYLLDHGVGLFLWIGPATPSHLLLDIFGVDDIETCCETLNEMQDVRSLSDDPCHISNRVHNLIEKIRFDRTSYLALKAVHSRSRQLPEFHACLVESTMRPPAGSKTPETSPDLMSYTDFLCHVHREIQDRLI